MDIYAYFAVLYFGLNWIELVNISLIIGIVLGYFLAWIMIINTNDIFVLSPNFITFTYSPYRDLTGRNLNVDMPFLHRILMKNLAMWI